MIIVTLLLGWLLNVTSVGGFLLLWVAMAVFARLWSNNWLEAIDRKVALENAGRYRIESGDIVKISRFPDHECKVLLVDAKGVWAVLKLEDGETFDWPVSGLWLVRKAEDA